MELTGDLIFLFFLSVRNDLLIYLLLQAWSVKSKISKQLNRPIFHMLVLINMCYCNNKLPPKDLPKNKHFEKSFSVQQLFCTCDQEIQKIPGRNSILVKLQSYILQLYQTMNCFTVIFSKFLITTVEWYIIMVR